MPDVNPLIINRFVNDAGDIPVIKVDENVYNDSLAIVDKIKDGIIKNSNVEVYVGDQILERYEANTVIGNSLMPFLTPIFIIVYIILFITLNVNSRVV
ncbi:hypothetical protein AAGS61_13955 [Lysinibacillus sp. KU-BSD001]|uniref:hypothetical protein n=1 Tax=Lysinibacillus sp. KU-BSD001 TaxID=3141328 RepID=UPI0036EE3E0C